ncbi:MAG: alpha/beta hydrolase [Patescibacteria group bacterium]
MSKKVLLLHGTDDSPDKNWLPWLTKQLEQLGYDVACPQLPDCDVPDRKKYNDFIFENSLYPSGGVIIGHSSGAVEVMNLLHDGRADKVHGAVLIAPWLHLEGADVLSEHPEKFGPIHGHGNYSWDTMKSKATHKILLHSDDDPYCPFAQGMEIAELLDAELISYSGHRHFTPNPLEEYSKTFPGLIDLLKKHSIV